MALFFPFLPFFIYLFIYFKTSFGYEKQGSVEMEASEQGWGGGTQIIFLFSADSMYPVRQLRRDNRSILHMSVFL